MRRIAQPLELYTYQNTPYGGSKYPQFLGPRSWYGGFGNSKKPSRKPTKKDIRISKRKKGNDSKNGVVDQIDEGDTVTISSKGDIQKISKK
jgi:hypothetical protein